LLVQFAYGYSNACLMGFIRKMVEAADMRLKQLEAGALAIRLTVHKLNFFTVRMRWANLAAKYQITWTMNKFLCARTLCFYRRFAGVLNRKTSRLATAVAIFAQRFRIGLCAYCGR